MESTIKHGGDVTHAIVTSLETVTTFVVQVFELDGKISTRKIVIMAFLF